MAEPIIRMRNIYKRFYIGQPNELEILHGIDLDVMPGEFLSIVGPSGSGKSTLMNLIGVLDRPTEGHYVLDGITVSEAKDDRLSAIRNKSIGFFQSFFQQQFMIGMIPDHNHRAGKTFPKFFCPLGISFYNPNINAVFFQSFSQIKSNSAAANNHNRASAGCR